MSGRQKRALIWFMVLPAILGMLGLACNLPGSEVAPSLLTPVETAIATRPPFVRPRTPRPVATFPVETPTIAPSPTPPPGTEGTSWQIAALIGEGDDINDLAFSPDGAQLATASRDGLVRLVDPVSGLLLRTFVGHSGHANRVAYSPDGNWLLSAADDGTVLRWDALSGARLVALGDSTMGSVAALDISPDGALMVSSGGVGGVNLWDATTNELKHRFIGGLSRISGLGFSPNSSGFVSVDLQGRIMLYPVDGRDGSEFADDPDPVMDVVYTDGNHLATASKSGVWLRDLGSDQAIVLEPASAVGPVDRLAVSKDGALLAAVARDGTIWVWELGSLQLRAAIPAQGEQALSLAFGPVCHACPTEPGWLLAVGGKDGRVWLWGIQERLEG